MKEKCMILGANGKYRRFEGGTTLPGCVLLHSVNNETFKYSNSDDEYRIRNHILLIEMQYLIV